MLKLIGLGIRVFFMWLQNRFDPDMIRFREITRIRNATKRQQDKIERAVSRGDTVAIADVFRKLRPKDSRSHGE